jgi:AbrB family looped-hinge helix DNA binding protein
MAASFSTVSSKGQIVIPAALRGELGITAGTRIAMQRQGGRISLQPVTERFIRSLRGYFKGGLALSALREREHKIGR